MERERAAARARDEEADRLLEVREGREPRRLDDGEAGSLTEDRIRAETVAAGSERAGADGGGQAESGHGDQCQECDVPGDAHTPLSSARAGTGVPRFRDAVQPLP